MVFFVKLSKEWDPPVWLVPSSNVSLQPVLLCHFSFFIFFFLLPRALSSHWERELNQISQSSLCDWKLCRQRGIRETTLDWVQAGSWDMRTLRSWDRWVGALFFGFGFFCFVFFFFFFFFSDVGFDCGFPVHSFGRSKEEDGLPWRSNETWVATVGNTSGGVHGFGKSL